MSAAAQRAEIPNDLAAFWMPFTSNRAFKQRPRLIARSKDMHYYTPEGREILDATAALWCCNAGHNRGPDRRGDPAPGGRARFQPDLPLRPSAGVPARLAHRRAGAGRSRPRVLRQLRLGGVRHRAEDRPRLSQRPRRRLAPAADRPRARLPRRRLRRHLGRRHVQQPQVLRLAADRRRPSAGDLQPRTSGFHQGRAGMGRPSRRRARRASSRCTTLRPSPR